MALILASTSPRRRELLQQLGLEFTCEAPHVDESAYAHLHPSEQAATLALMKAHDVAVRCPHAHVLGGDTIVVLADRVFGKPTSEADAEAMLGQLQGRTHEVITALALVSRVDDLELVHVDTALVTIKSLTSAEIHAYVATGEPMDKAGAYAAQGIGQTLIERIEGDYYTVVGMSVRATQHLFEQAGMLPKQP